MADFTFLKNPVSGRWVVLAPKRSKRPDASDGTIPVCPFCPGHGKNEEEVFRIPSSSRGDHDWKIRVVKNKYPFAKVHEVIVHSPDHQKNFDALDQKQNEYILRAYVHRYNEHMHKGQVVIFHNHGVASGESLPHPHSQLVVIPDVIHLVSSRLETGTKGLSKDDMHHTSDFHIFCPNTSMWPDEVWVKPKKQGRVFGEITCEEISDLAMLLKRLVQIFTARYQSDFPFNLHIYSGEDFYIRFVPRIKRLGGFEIATDVYVNTQKPEETIAFIKTHFENPDISKIEKEHQATYHHTA